MRKVDRSELGFWAEGTQWNTNELETLYLQYLLDCERSGSDPVGEARWANEILGIPNEPVNNKSDTYRFENGKLFKLCKESNAYVKCFSSPYATDMETAVAMYEATSE